jgi:thiol-disulfide isomerase/thioredoxin
MKRINQYTLLTLLFFGLWSCQIFKEPAAKLMSTTLPTPEVEVKKANNLPNADYALRVKDLEGNIINMEDYKGKVIFLNFWATWCMPCVAELPSINKLYLEFKNDDVAFLLISNEQAEKVKNYHTKKAYDVPFHIIDNDGIIPSLYEHQGIPTTFIINRDGKIVKASSGAEDWDDDEFIEAINEML